MFTSDIAFRAARAGRGKGGRGARKGEFVHIAYTRHAKRAFLVATSGLALLVLPGSPSTFVDVQYLFGRWQNVKTDQSPPISALTVRAVNSEVAVQAWGNCRPVNCYWGEDTATVYYGSGASFPVLFARFETSYSVVVVLLSQSEAHPEDKLEVTVLTRYSDRRGLSNYAIRNEFRRAEELARR